ncbi:ABC transporter permease [Mycoplasma elephantis]|uniref:ABC transporter permease n=1 Tax=Mycoplasma elephantis TaxID=114882 RepID=UPI0004890440|nr:ABC transporter permease [Mycoplasma elephantis]
MIKLFKEVFKSLSKNKVIIIGLTFLVFLTSGIFTLLFNLRSSFNNQFDDYKKVSKLHNITADLNLPSSGSSYAGGYFVNDFLKDNQYKKDKNGEFKTSKEWKNKYGERNWDDPITYVSKNDWEKKPSYKVDLFSLEEEKNKDYISLKSFNANWDDNLYLKKSDFNAIYSHYLVNKNSPDKNLYNFILKNKDSYFEVNEKVFKDLNKKPTFVIYKKNNNNYDSNLVNKNLFLDDKFILEDYYTNSNEFSKLVNFQNSEDNTKIYFKNITPAFFNIDTKKITFDFSEAKEWINLGVGIKLSSENTAKLFKLKRHETYQNLFVEDNDSNVFLFEPIIENNHSKKIFKNWKLNTKECSFENLKPIIFEELKKQFLDRIDLSTPNKIVLKVFDIRNDLFLPNEKYAIDSNFVFKEIQITKYFKKHFTSTYSEKYIKPDIKYKDLWTGSFKSFMEKISDFNTPENSEYINKYGNIDEYEKLSYWSKQLLVFSWKADTNSFDLKQNLFNFSNISEPSFIAKGYEKDNVNVVGIEDIEKILYCFNENETNLKKDNNNELEEYTIRNIEKEYHSNWDKNIKNDQILKKIFNPNIKNNQFEKISKGAEFFNIQESIRQITNLIGKENIGYRETLTIDGFNEETNKKNVFHFVNTGDENNEINNVKLKIGKLYNEFYEPTMLNSISSSKSLFYKTKQLPTYVAAQVVAQIFKNVNPDPEYFDTDIRFEQVGVVNKITNEIKTYNSQKVVVLSPYLLDENSKDINSDVFIEGENKYQYAITKIVNKFILLRRNKDETLWKSVDPNLFKDQEIKKSDNRMNEFEMKNFFIKNNWFTIHYNSPIKEHGWAKQDPQFKNFVYLPMIYLAAHNELISEAYKTGTVNFMVSNVERVLLNLDLVKNNFIDVEFISKFVSVGKKILEESNFGKVFATGKINLKIIPILMIDIFYELSNENPGIINKLFSNFFQQVNLQILNQPNFEKYFEKEFNKMNYLFDKVFGFSILKKIPAETLLNISKDPREMIQAFSDLINSIDFKKWLSIMHDFFHLKDSHGNNLYYGSFDNENYERVLSSIDIIKPLLASIDTHQFTKSLVKLIESIDFNSLLGHENSILSSLLPSDSPLWKIIDKLNQNNDSKNHPENNFKELKMGLIKLINILDLDLFFKKLGLNNFEGDRVDVYYSPNIVDGVEDPSIIHKLRLGMFKLSNIIKAFFESIFEGKQNNVILKNILIDMFNLSNKTEPLMGINIPAPDDKKISIFDLISLTNVKKDSNKLNEFQIFDLLSKTVNDINEKVINKNYLNRQEIEFINYYLDIDTDLIDSIYIEKLKEKLKNFSVLKDILIGNNSILNISNNFLNISQTNGSIGIITDKFNELLNKPEDIYGQSSLMSPLYFYLTKLFTNIDNSEDAKYVAEKILNFIFLPSSKEILDELISEKLEPNEPNIRNINILKTVNGLVNYRNIADKWCDFKNNSYLKKYIEQDPILAKYLFKKTSSNNVLFEEIKYDTFYYFAMLASSKKFTKDDGFESLKNGSYYLTQKQFIDLVTKKDNFENIDLLSKFIYKYSKTSQILLNLNIPPLIINPYLTPINTGILLSFISNTNKDGQSLESGNLAHILLNKIADFDQLTNNKIWLKSFIDSILLDVLPEKNNIYSLISKDQLNNLVIDNAYFDYLKKLDEKQDLSVFGINLVDLIYESIHSITYKSAVDDLINFSDVGSYVAKANYLYLSLNNKEIYKPKENFKIPTDPVEIEKLIAQLDDKYILNVNGSKFIILGEETTVDYLYPVIDENNLQVNSKNQAIVYVNNKGFDRIRNAYQGNVVKKYLLIKNNKDIPNEQLKQDVEKVISDITGPGDLIKRVYLYDEIDPINPERSMRVMMPSSIINMIDKTSVLIISALITLVALSIIFIIRRYITSKSKVLGILMSQGYSRKEIATSLLVFSAFTSIIGGVLGYVIGSQMQLYLMDIFGNYWTLPKEKIPFNWFSMIFTIFIPFIGSSLLIFVITYLMLCIKPIDLMRGSNEISFKKTQTLISKSNKLNIKNKFSLSLILNSIGKLISFMFSILLTTIVCAFSIVSIGKFESITKDTYSNRYYNYKIDLGTPTLEGGVYRTYGSQDLGNSIYVPSGTSNEIETPLYNYFRPGYSKAINYNNNNGNVAINSKNYEPHIITQFSVNIGIDAGVSVDPWQITYNSMPDTQKSKVNAVRDSVGFALQNAKNPNYELHYKLHDIVLQNIYEKLKKTYPDRIKLITDIDIINNIEHKKEYDLEIKDKLIKKILQYEAEANSYNEDKIDKYYNSLINNNLIFKYVNLFGVYALDKKTNKKTDFFLYTNTKINNEFKYCKKVNSESYNEEDITSTSHRSEYRDFLINGYKSIYLNQFNNSIFKINNNYKDYYISFGGVFLDPKHDEKYTYVESKINDSIIKIYGYKENSKFIKLTNNLSNNLHKYQGKYIPLIVNEVASHKFNLHVGSVIELSTLNKTNRYTNKLKEIINNKKNDESKCKFEVVGINKTFINYEFITTKQKADEILGLDKLFNNLEEPFNGIMTDAKMPEQVTGSSTLYSPSGYWPALNNFEIETLSQQDKEQIFDNLFGTNVTWTSNNSQDSCVFEELGFTKEETMKFLGSFDNPIEIKDAKANQLEQSINKYSGIFDKQLYVALATSIDSKDIESGFALNIAGTIESLLISIIVISFTISIIILVIISTILINENQRNIAILNVLGYSQKERIWLIFSVFVPFIIIALIMSIPITIFLINLFTTLILNSSSIFLPLTLTIWPVFVTTVIIFTVFLITTSLAWYSINKMKAIDLLKGK